MDLIERRNERIRKERDVLLIVEFNDYHLSRVETVDKIKENVDEMFYWNLLADPRQTR
jgi:hypothetical protein